MTAQSWIVTDRRTGRAVGEFYSPAIIAKINLANYEVLTAREHLERFNAKIKTA